jgi:hypothetical protein
METLEIIKSLEAAAAVIRTARLDSAQTSSVIWKQVNRVYEYVDAQIAELLITLKSEGGE